MAVLRRLACALALLLAAAAAVRADPLKALVDVEGVRGNPLVGYGIVVGLAGTGDSANSSPFTLGSIAAMLERFGVNVRAQLSQMKPKNAAAVIVTAELPPFARPGQQLDVTVASLGDAKSLRGGELLMTPLRGGDGRIYAVAQGAVLTGGFFAAGRAASATKNNPTTGRIPGGARVEAPAPAAMLRTQPVVVLHLKRPDFSLAVRIARAIDGALGVKAATAVDAGAVEVRNVLGDAVRLVASLERVDVPRAQDAVVVVDERTGTIVMGGDIRLDPVAVAHGDISVTIRETPEVSQPQPFSEGKTRTVPRTDVNVKEKQAKLVLVPRQATLAELVNALNAIGASPSDLIAVLQAIQKAGALHAELRTL